MRTILIDAVDMSTVRRNTDVLVRAGVFPSDHALIFIVSGLGFKSLQAVDPELWSEEWIGTSCSQPIVQFITDNVSMLVDVGLVFGVARYVSLIATLEPFVHSILVRQQMDTSGRLLRRVRSSGSQTCRAWKGDT